MPSIDLSASVHTPVPPPKLPALSPLIRALTDRRRRRAHSLRSLSLHG